MIYLLRIESLERDPVETGGVVAPPPGVVARLSADDELALAKPWVELEILWKTNTVKLFYQHLTELKINAKILSIFQGKWSYKIPWIGCKCASSTCLTFIVCFAWPFTSQTYWSNLNQFCCPFRQQSKFLRPWAILISNISKIHFGFWVPFFLSKLTPP